MSAPFDPYQAWLDIPPEHQPPDHYRLLGVKRFEHNVELIERAAQQRTATLHAHESGPHAEQCRRLLREVAAARNCLMNDQRRAAYDRALLESAVQEAARPAKRGTAFAVNAEEFLDLLEQKDLLPGELLLSLRRRLLEMGGSVSAQKVAQLLVRKGLLTPVLARRLLESAGASAAPREATPQRGPAAQKKGRRTAEQATRPGAIGPQAGKKAHAGGKAAKADVGSAPEEDLGLAPLEEELGLAPLEDKQRATTAPQAQSPSDTSPARTSPKPSAGKARAAAPKTKKPAKAETPKDDAGSAGPSGPEGFGSLLDEELPPLDAEGAGAVGDLLSGDAADLAAAPGLAPAPAAWRAQGGWSARRMWQSRWAWAAGAGVLVLLVVVVAIYRVVGARSAAAALPQAEAHFQAGHYAEAVPLYDRYLSWHSDQPRAGPARVARVRARLHQLVEQPADPVQILEAAREMLPGIGNEAAYDEQAAADVALLLGRVAETCMAAAREKQDAATLEQARAAVELIERFAPQAAAQGNAVPRLEAALAITARNVSQDKAAAHALAAFDRAAQADDPQAAQRALVAVLEGFPELASNEQLQNALRSMPGLWQKAAAWVEQALEPGQAPQGGRASQAEQARGASPAVHCVVFCRNTPAEPPAQRAGRPVLAKLRGAVWALDEPTGRVLWQRPLGPASAQAAMFLPGQPTTGANRSSAAGDSVLLADQMRGELVCVEPANGRLRWRLAIDGPVGVAAALLDGKAVVAARDGKVLAVDPARGTAQGHFQLPAAVRLAPAVDPGRGLVFQPAHDGRVLFVLDVKQQRCVQAGVLGESPQRLAGPVVLSGDRLLAAVNGPGRSGVLMVFAVSSSRSSQRGPLRLLQRIPLQGRLAGPPVVGDGEVLVVTRWGRASLFQWDGQQRLKLLLSQDLTDAKGLPGVDHAPRASHLPGEADLPCSARLSGDRLWMARGPLHAFRIDRAAKRLVLEWTDPARQSVAELLPADRHTVCYVRRAAGVPGAVVAALPAAGALPAALAAPGVGNGPSAGAAQHWQTELGAPLLPGSLVQTPSGQCLAANAAGAVFAWQWSDTSGTGRPEAGTPHRGQTTRADSSAEVACVIDRALAVAEPESPERPFQWAARCGEFLVLLAGGTQSAWVFDPEDAQRTLHQVWLPGAPACRPVVWNDKLLVATSDAQVWLFNLRTGSAAAGPFQAPIAGDAMPVFCGLAVVDESQAVVCDTRARLWQLRVEQQPVPCLTGSPAAMRSPIGSAPAVAGGSVFALEQGGRLARCQPPELDPQPTKVQATQPAWGPVAAGGRIWLADAQGRVACVSAHGGLLWQVTIEDGPPRAAPLVDGQSVWLATAHGAVVRLALEAGEQLERVQTARMLTSGVLRCGDRLVVCTADGALVEVGAP